MTSEDTIISGQNCETNTVAKPTVESKCIQTIRKRKRTIQDTATKQAKNLFKTNVYMRCEVSWFNFN